MSSDMGLNGIEPSAHVRAPDLLRIRSIGIDDWSDVRYVHGNAFRTIVAPHIAPDAVDGFLATLGGPGYADRLAASDLTGA